ncbi:MAG: hypothetical protein ACFFEV_08075, partial [Candidatus Thorarchaeota archaeon]
MLYLPWTFMSAALTADTTLIWVYYFSLVIGLLFPMYYAIGKEKMAWICLGLSLMINSVLWLLLDPLQILAAVLVLIVGFLFFIGTFLEDRMGNWDMIKNVFHFLKGLFLVLAIAFYAAFDLNAMIGPNSANHIMPQFIFMGGAIMVAFAVCLMAYGLFKLLKMFLPESIGGFFGDLANIFYMLMVISFLLGIVYNVSYYPIEALTNPWTPAYVLLQSTSLDFFRGLAAIGLGNLGAILLIILFIYGMGKIAKKFE